MRLRSNRWPFGRALSGAARGISLILVVGLALPIGTQAQNSPVTLGKGATAAEVKAPGKRGLGGPQLELGIPAFLAGQVHVGTTADLAGVPMIGEMGITETVSEIMGRESLTVATAAAQKRALALRGNDRRRILPVPPAHDPEAEAASQWPPVAERNAFELDVQRMAPQTVSTAFDGITRTGVDPNTSADDESFALPPDTVGDVGPTQVLFAANGRIKVFDKAGNLGGLNVELDTFFNSVRNNFGSGEPRVRYDRLAQKWFVIASNLEAANNRILVAVSGGPTITNSSSFTFFFFNPPAADSALFHDYPTLGVDKNALYIGTNNFTNVFVSTTAFVIKKSSVTGGGPIFVTAFRNFHSAAAGGDGTITPYGVDNDDPNATDGFVVGTSAAAFSRLVLARIIDPGSNTPLLSNKYNLTTLSAPPPIAVFAKDNVAKPIDAVGTRLYAAAIRRNKVSNTQSLWTAQAIEVDASGAGNDSGGRNGSRWYEIAELGATPTINQQGTLFDSAGSNPRHFWMPSAIANGQGHMALGTSVASVNDFPGIAVAGRLASDPLGTIQSYALAQPGVAVYSENVTDPMRWGDYSQTVVDPTDDQTIWTFQMYSKTVGTNIAGWAVQVVKLRAPPPATPASASPGSVAQGASNVNVVITGNGLAGSGFFDPGPNDAGATPWNHIVGAVSGTGVTVNSVTFTDPTHVTLNLTVSGGAAAGARNVTITNPDGQTATGNGLITVTAGGGGATVNLVVASVTTTPKKTAAAANQSITINATTKNTGTGTAGSTITKAYLSSNSTLGAGDVALGQYPPIPSLGASASIVQSASFTIPAGTATGKWLILAQADSGLTQGETSEKDNVKNKAIYVGPDLYISKLTRTPSSTQANTNVTIKVWTKNMVGADTAGASTTKVFYSQDGVLDPGDTLLITRPVPSLNGGQEDKPAAFVVTIPASATPGSRFILAVADELNAVAESIEGTKNTKKVALTIQ